MIGACRSTLWPMVACIVLAGGQARRMGGVDKVVLRVGDLTLLDRVLAAAEPLCSTLVVVGPVRPTSFPNVVFTIEKEPGGGPAPAVLAGMAETAGADAVFVLAADLAMLTTGALKQLLAALNDGGCGAAAAPDGEGKPNPLLAVYRTAAIRSAARQWVGSHHGMPAWRLLPDDTVVVPIDVDESLNVNTRADLAAAMSADQKRKT